MLPTSNNIAEFGGRLKVVHGLSEVPTMLQAEQSSVVDVLVGLRSSKIKYFEFPWIFSTERNC
jgi:hypothetical protein